MANSKKSETGEIRLLLLGANGLFKICKISLNPSSIVGWYMGDHLRADIGLSPEDHLDCHFTYPKSGNCHYSYKSINKGHEEYISVYWDHVRVKNIKRDEHDNIVDRNDTSFSREEFAESPRQLLAHLVHGFETESWASVKCHQFFAMSFNVFNGTFNTKATDKLEEADIRLNDLIVDVRNFDKYGVSISAMLKEPALQAVPRLYPNGQSHSIMHKVNERLEIEISCALGLNEQL